MTARKKISNKVVWLDASVAEDYDPRNWGDNVPAIVRGRLTPTKVKAIRQLFIDGNFNQTQLAEMFHTTISNINHVVHRKTWRWM